MIAVFAMIRRSQASASDRPAPAAAPGRAAIVGFGILNSLPEVARWLNRWRWIASSMETGRPAPVVAAVHGLDVAAGAEALAPRRSAPRTFTSGASSAQARLSASASFIGPLMALRASGRLSVRVSTPSSRRASRSLVPVSISAMVAFLSKSGSLVARP